MQLFNFPLTELYKAETSSTEINLHLVINDNLLMLTKRIRRIRTSRLWWKSVFKRSRNVRETVCVCVCCYKDFNSDISVQEQVFSRLEEWCIEFLHLFMNCITYIQTIYMYNMYAKVADVSRKFWCKISFIRHKQREETCMSQNSEFPNWNLDKNVRY